MLIRVITALVALCVLIPVLFLSDTWVLPVAVAVFNFIANFELFKCIGSLSKCWLSWSMLVFSAIIPLLVRIIDSIGVYYIVVACILFSETLYLMALAVFSKGTISIEDIGISAFMSFYVSLGFTSIILLHDFFSMGKQMYLLIFVGAWVTDIFAYFCGRLFGKHKLIPQVSPKKTVEGSIGGTLFSGISFVLFGFIINKMGFGGDIGYAVLFVFGIIAAVVAQIGDLCMSALKRRYGIKDFGKLFPGHGGVLDRFDSIIAVAVSLLIMNTVIAYI